MPRMVGVSPRHTAFIAEWLRCTCTSAVRGACRLGQGNLPAGTHLEKMEVLMGSARCSPRAASGFFPVTCAMDPSDQHRYLSAASAMQNVMPCFVGHHLALRTWAAIVKPTKASMASLRTLEVRSARHPPPPPPPRAIPTCAHTNTQEHGHCTAAANISTSSHRPFLISFNLRSSRSPGIKGAKMPPGYLHATPSPVCIMRGVLLIWNSAEADQTAHPGSWSGRE